MGITNHEAELTVTHGETEPGPFEHYDEDAFNATRTLKCAWADRHTLARQLRGWITGEWPNFDVHLPHRYPAVQGAFVRSVNPKGMGKSSAHNGDTTRLSYAHAELTVGYSTKGQSQGQGGGDSPIAIVTEGLESSAEYITLSGEDLMWEEQDGPPLQPGDATAVTRMVDWVYTIHQLTNLPASFGALEGYVNNSQVFSHSLNRAFDPETLLYQGASPRRIITTEGAEAWEVTLRFTHKRFGWNKWWRSGYDIPQPMYTFNGEYKPFPQADFVNQLVLP